MAEISRFWTTDGTGDGPSGGYNSEQFADFMIGVFGEGVLTGVGSELAVSGVVSPVSIVAGAGIVAGRFYESTTVIQLPISSPVVGTTGFRILLRASWSLQTVRVAAKLSSDGNPNPPNLTQSAGDTWEVSVFTGTIDVSGNIILTDARIYAQYATKRQVIGAGDITTEMLADGAVTNIKLDALSVSQGKIQDDAISEDKLQTDAVTRTKIAGGAVTEYELQTDAVTREKIAQNAVTNFEIDDGTIISSNIADDNVVVDKLGAGAARLRNRQGGSATDWNLQGLTTHTTGCVEIQVGVSDFEMIPSSVNQISAITFPYAYLDGIPIVIACLGNMEADIRFSVEIVSKIQTQFRYKRDAPEGAIFGNVFWMAIGGRTSAT